VGRYQRSYQQNEGATQSATLYPIMRYGPSFARKMSRIQMLKRRLAYSRQHKGRLRGKGWCPGGHLIYVHLRPWQFCIAVNFQSIASLSVFRRPSMCATIRV
jgi:hypothetical protein